MTTGEMDWNKVWLRGGWGSLRGGNGVPKRMPRRLGHWELERDDYPKYFAYSLFYEAEVSGGYEGSSVEHVI